MTTERKVLLIIMELLILGILLQTTGGILKQKKRALGEKITLNEELLMRLDKTTPDPIVSKELQEKVKYLYALFDHDKGLYAFGREAGKQLLCRGLSLENYSEKKGRNGNFLEYNLKGSPQAFLSFLENPGIPVSISYLSMDCRKNMTHITLGISPPLKPQGMAPPPGYETTVDFLSFHHNNNFALPVQLASLFPSPSITNKTILPLPPSTLEIEKEIIKNHLIYIGRVETGDKGLHYGFKEKSGGPIILVNPGGEPNKEGWSLTNRTDISMPVPFEPGKGTEPSFFLLTKENLIYEVNL